MMAAILVIVLLGLLLLGDRVKLPRRTRKYHRNPAASKVVEATPDPEYMDRYFTAAVLADVIDKEHYRARMEALAATTELYADECAPSAVADPRLGAAARLARQGTKARELVRLLGITHADAVRVIITAGETR